MIMNKNIVIILLIAAIFYLTLSRSYYKKETAYWKNKYATCAVNKDLQDLNNPPSILEQ